MDIIEHDTTTIDELPEELLFLILAHIELRDIPAVVTTCRRFYNLFRYDLMWQAIYARSFGPHALPEPRRLFRELHNAWVKVDPNEPYYSTAVFDHQHDHHSSTVSHAPSSGGAIDASCERSTSQSLTRVPLDQMDWRTKCLDLHTRLIRLTPTQRWFFAAERGMISVLRHMLETNQVSSVDIAHVSSEWQSKGPQTAFHLATRLNDLYTARELVALKADPSQPLESGARAIHIAAYAGFSGFCDWLLTSCHADVNDCNFGVAHVPPILLASQEGHADTVSLLLSRNADPDLVGTDTSSSLQLAAYNGTSIDRAYIIDILVLDTCSSCSFNPIQSIQSNPIQSNPNVGHIEAVRVLVTNGASVNYAGQRHDTALTLACATRSDNRLPLIQLLLDAKAQVNGSASANATPLFYAVQAQDVNAVKLLLENRANPMIGYSPVQLARSSHNQAILDLLTR